MPIFDINGKNIKNYQNNARCLFNVIEDKLSTFAQTCNLLLVTPGTTGNEIQQQISEKKYDAVLIEMTSHACIVPEIPISDSISKFSIPVFHLSSNMEFFYNNHECVIWFPFWLFAVQTFPKNTLIIGSNEDVNRSHQISTTCRNLKHRPQRIHFYGKLLQRHYADEILKNFYRYDEFDFNFEEYNVELNYDEWLHFKNIYDAAPYFRESEQSAVDDTNFDIYTKAYVHILSETYIEYNFLSEKSYKPLLAGQMPMIYGCPNIMQMYKDIGFDMFDDIFEHSYYDNEPDWKQRITKIFDYLEIVRTMPLQKIFESTVTRRQKNLDYLYNNNLESRVVNDLITKLGRI